MQDFKDKVAVVTGGASGMGLAFANKFADEGMKVVLADIEAEPLAMAEAGIKAKGATVMAHRLDVSKPESVQALADRVFGEFGNVHILCNNAGVGGGAPKPTWDLSLADWEWVVGVNLWGVVHGIRSFMPRMVANGEEGHIVNTASMAGMGNGRGVYGITKHAVVALSESLYSELAQQESKLGVSVLCPGWVNTNILDAERNRPAEYGPAHNREDVPPQVAQMREMVREFVRNGFAPEEVAQMVFDAIRENKFYIFPVQPNIM
ncbi:hypothetical protein AYO38_08700, partial [bacterium SCGC AG-212-C10]